METMTSDQADRLGPPVAVFRAVGLKGVRFECRPLSRTPPEGTVALVYQLRADDRFVQNGVGVYSDGHWRRSKNGKPLEGNFLWTAMVDD